LAGIGDDTGPSAGRTGIGSRSSTVTRKFDGGASGKLGIGDVVTAGDR
jgi:hypothetical protein